MKNILKNKPRRSDCPITNTLDIFGDRWSLLIIRDMMFLDKREFGELITNNEKIATNILSDRLQRLQDAGIILKSSDPSNGTKYIYTLTERGIQFLPTMIEVIRWGMKNIPNTAMPKRFLQAMEFDREAFEKSVTANLEEKLMLEMMLL